MDEVREQAERDYQLASGISQDVETTDTVLTQTSARLPWLLIGMIGGLANSVILGNFEGNFSINPAMALFIPLIGGTGGNVGIQSSAIIVQGLANKSLSLNHAGKQILKEAGRCHHQRLHHIGTDIYRPVIVFLLGGEALDDMRLPFPIFGRYFRIDFRDLRTDSS